MPDQPLPFELGERSQWLLDRSLRWFRKSADPKIDHIQSVEAEVLQVVVSAVDELLSRESRNPGGVCTPSCAELGNDHQTLRIGMKRLLDDLIGDVRTVVVAGVDVVHAGLDRLSKNSNGAIHITRRSKDV